MQNVYALVFDLTSFLCLSLRPILCLARPFFLSLIHVLQILFENWGIGFILCSVLGAISYQPSRSHIPSPMPSVHVLCMYISYKMRYAVLPNKGRVYSNIVAVGDATPQFLIVNIMARYLLWQTAKTVSYTHTYIYYTTRIRSRIQHSRASIQNIRHTDTRMFILQKFPSYRERQQQQQQHKKIWFHPWGCE